MLAALSLAALLAGGPVVLGPVEDLALLDDLTAAAGERWQVRQGANIEVDVESGVELPGIAATLLRVATSRRDGADRDPTRNWLHLSRGDLPPGLIAPEATGLRLFLGSQAQAQWWMRAELLIADGTAYRAMVGDITLPAGRLVEFRVPLADFRDDAGRPLPAPGQVREFGLSTSLPGPALFLDRVTVYRQRQLTGWLELTSNQPACHLFEPGERVLLTLTPGGTPPPAATGVRVRVTDLPGTITLERVLPLAGPAPLELDATPPRHGYHEVRGTWVDAAGRDLPDGLCLRAEGTQQPGVATFAVLPLSVAANREQFARLGADSFFGLHGDFHGLADRIGLCWRMNYGKWFALEPTRPDRAAGPAPWAAERIAAGPEPPFRFHFLPFRGNMGAEVPPWARADGVPPFASWDDYLAFVRDYALAQRANYPHQRPRLYGALWEANLHLPPYQVQPPPMNPAQLVEILRRTADAVRATDPEAQILGPCPSVLDLDWFEAMFQAGALELIDGIETHGYLERVFTPEANDFPGKLAGLRELMRRYGGRELPVYVTELGLRGQLGAENIARAQAEQMVRAAVILKGEGVRVFFPFYGIDYDHADGWGFAYNLDVDAPHGPWGTRRIAPKPLVTALAACALLLEGTVPDGRLSDLGEGVWAYRFRSAEATITAAWCPDGGRAVAVPVPGAARVERFGLEGHPLPADLRDGAVEVELGPAVTYLVAR